MAEVSGRKVLLWLGVFGVLSFALAMYVANDLGGAVRASKARLALDGGVGTEILSEEDRAAYMESGLKLEDFSVGPEFKPGTEEPVPGLLKVQGKVANVGDKTVHVAHVEVITKGEDGKVRSSFLHNVLERGALAPGEVRPFSFRIPDKSEYKDFEHRLR